jgi:putative tryptophan/tyrosine transport system substrate-binding protein
MKRREFIKMLGSSAAAWPLTARAQQAHVPKIGVLVAGTPDPQPFWTTFQKAMHDLGYVEGRNIQFEYRSAEGDRNRLKELAADLVRDNVDIIVTFQTPTVTAAKQVTQSIPIVMASAGDPVGTGLIASLARPGGNVTGMAGVTAELAGKTVELIRQIIPSSTRVAALCNGPDPFSKPFLEHIQLGGKAVGIAIKPIILTSNDQLNAAFSSMSDEHVDAVVVQPSLPTRRTAELALDRHLPAVSVPRRFAQEGGLLAYSARLADMYGEAATYVDKILKGAKPADLPVEQPTKFELVLNLKTAKALGLTFPPQLLAVADDVIQ